MCYNFGRSENFVWKDVSKMRENKLSSGILYALIAAAVFIGVLALTAVRSAGRLEEFYLESMENSQAAVSEMVAVKDSIGSAEKNLLEAFSTQDDASEIEYLNAAQADLDVLEAAVTEDRLGLWKDAAPVSELIGASQLRSAVFGSVNGGSRNIARNVFYSEYQPKLKAAEEYADGLLDEVCGERVELSEKISARAAFYERVCVGIGLLGISAMTFTGLYLDKKLREAAKTGSGEIREAPADKYEPVCAADETEEQLAEAEETIANAVSCINILADGDPDAAADGEYPYRYENVLSAVRKMKARLKFISAQINRAAEFVSAESARVSDNAEELSSASAEQEKASEHLNDSISRMTGLISQGGELSGKIKSGSEKCASAAEECGIRLSALGDAADMLEKGADSLDAVSSLAADIAGRANRLAVSAAVNAARGECEKNIAVFADEARGLALCASKLSEDASEAVRLLGSGIKESSAAAVSASENISGVIDREKELYGEAVKLETICAEELEALTKTRECTDTVSGFVKLSRNASEEYAASGRMLSEQSAALKRIFD